MCGPIAGIVGAAVAAAGSIYSGMAQAAGYEASAKAKKVESVTQLDSAGYDMNRQQAANDQLAGQQVTATASSGVDLWGSPTDVINSSRIQGEMDKSAIRFNGQAKYKSLQYGAAVDKMNAQNARTGGFIGALAPVVSGIGGIFQA